MNKEISEKLVSFMNSAERRYADPQQKEEFVIHGISQLYPDMTVEQVKELITLLIGVSKLSTKMLFNKNLKCCNIFRKNK